MSGGHNTKPIYLIAHEKIRGAVLIDQVLRIVGILFHTAVGVLVRIFCTRDNPG